METYFLTVLEASCLRSKSSRVSSRKSFLLHLQIATFLLCPYMAFPQYILKEGKGKGRRRKRKREGDCRRERKGIKWALMSLLRRPLILWDQGPTPMTFSSVQFSRSVVSDSLRPHESQYARPPCPSPSPCHVSTNLYMKASPPEVSNFHTPLTTIVTHNHTHTSNTSLANVDLSLQTSVIDQYSFLLSSPLPTSLI